MEDTQALYSVKGLPLHKTALLGLQHTFAMFGATVLVPLLTGLSIQTTLLMAGLGTLLFHFLTGGKVPAFLGSSFAYLGGYAAVAPMVNGKADPLLLAYAGGGVAVSGLVYLVLAGFIKLYGVKKVMRFFPPVVTGPIIISIGLILAPTAIANASHDWLLAVVAAVIIVVCNIWGRGMVRIIPIVLGVVLSYLLALALDRVSFEAVAQAPLIGLPPINFARFNLSAIITIVPISLATMMEHIGDISAISATTGINYISKPGLSLTLTGDGLATSMSAIFGGPANTTYGENTGVLALTRIYDPVVMRIAACFAVLLAFVPVLSEGIRTIPVAIIGGVSLILYGMISAIGVRNLVENQVDFTKSRNLIVAATILVTALGFNGIGGLKFSVWGTEMTLSGLAIAAILGIILNAILPGKDYEFTEEDHKPTGVDFEAGQSIATTKEGKTHTEANTK